MKKVYILTIVSYTSLLCAYESGDDYEKNPNMYIPIDADKPSDEQLTVSKNGRNTGQKRRFQGHYPEHVIKNYYEHEYDRWISIYSGYIESQYNNYDLATFGLELLNGIDYILTKVDDDGCKWKTYACSAFFGYVYYMYELAYHEVGHGLKSRAHKGQFELLTEGEDVTGSKSENFWGYFGKLMLRFSFSGSTYSDSLLINTDSDDYKKGNTLIYGAGVNNEMFLTERIANEAWKGKIYGKFSSVAYLLGRLSPLFYALDESNTPGHDINGILETYQARQIDVSRSNIQMAYAISLIGGTTLNAIKNLLGKSQCPDIEEQTFYNFRIPDVFPYLTSHGVSYKFVSGYKVSEEFRINVGYERVIHGNTRHEISAGGVFDTGDLSVEVNTYFGSGGFSLETGVSYKLSKRLKINGRMASYSTNGLVGERQAKRLVSGLKMEGNTKKGYNWAKRNNMISIGLSYGYGKTL